MCDSQANTVSKLEDGHLYGYIECEACGDRREVHSEPYTPDPKLEMPTPPAE